MKATPVLKAIKRINWSMLIAFAATLGYQLVYPLASFFLKGKKSYSQPDLKRDYAVLICARNEEDVIANLVTDLRNQDYTGGRLDIYVIADNCTDETARAAKKAGAIVCRRYNKRRVGKGYALRYLYRALEKTGRAERYDGFFIFDADNRVEPDYVTQMNRVFGDDYPVVTSFRNSRNISDSWIAYNSGLWFLHDAQFLNRSRMLLGSSCMVNGTGYMVSREIIEKAGGWSFLLMTEDVEFNAWCIQNKIRIGYCEKAVFYDTQPLTFEDSWNQRVRWTRGFFDVYRRHAPGLARGLVKGELGLGAFDMLMSNMAPFAVTACAAIAYGVIFLISFTSLSRMRGLLKGLFRAGSRILIILMALGFFTTAEQWKTIDAPWYKKIGYTFLFPLYLFSYAPVSIAALTRSVEWKDTDHATKDEQSDDSRES